VIIFLPRKTIDNPKGCVIIVPNLAEDAATATATATAAVAATVAVEAARVVLDGFRQAFYDCLTARADALFDLCDAVLCTSGPVVSLAELSMTGLGVGVRGRGHGALYDGLASGRIEVARLRMALARLELPRGPGGWLMIAVDVTAWPRPDAACSPDRVHCHQNCRCQGKRGKSVPGWPYSVAAALGTGRTSWTAPLDVVRLGAADDPTEVTATQIRGLTERLIEAGQHQPGDPPILFVLDSGYDLPRLQHLLADLPVRLLGRIRSDRVLYHRAEPRPPGRAGPQPRHGTVFKCATPATWHPARHETTSSHDRYGQVHTRVWHRLHPKLAARYNWADHDIHTHGDLPIIEASIIQVTVDRLPGNRTPKPLWLWASDPDLTATDLDLAWRSYLRRFDLEHTFRFFKQTLGLTRPRVRTSTQADRWAWLLIAGYTQLRLARTLTTDYRNPWEKPLTTDRATPGRVRRGFRHLRRITHNPARTPKPSRPGPGRPPGSTTGPAPRHPVTKKPNKRDTPRRGGTKPA